MENLPLFAIKNLIFTGILFIFYQIFIKGNTFHQTNRITILLIYIGGLVFPFLEFTLPNFDSNHNQIFSENVADLTIIGSDNSVIFGEENNRFVYESLVVFYLVGVLIFLLKYIIGIISLRRILHNSKKTQLTDSEIIYVTSKNISPFSWFSYIVIPKLVTENDFQNIINHEKAHIQFGHSWDLLFVELYNSFFWWNPFVWLLKKQLVAVHEFQADKRAISQTNDENQYRKELISRCVGSRKMALAHNFETSNLKNRIHMSMKEKSTRKAKLGYATLVLATSATIALFSTEMLQAQEKSNITHQKPEIKVIGFQKQPTDSLKGKVRALYASDVLLIVDGKETENTKLQEINPDEIASITVLKDEKALQAYGDKAKNGVILVSKRKENNSSLKITGSKIPQDLLLIVDGKEMENSELKQMNPDEIESITVLKDEKALQTYGAKAKNGVVLVTKKRGVSSSAKEALLTAMVTNVEGNTLKVIAPKEGNVIISGDSSNTDFYINKKKATSAEVKALKGSDVSSIAVKHPKKGKNNRSVVEIFLK